MDLLQNGRVLPKAVDEAIVFLDHRSGNRQLLGVEGSLIGKEKADSNGLVTHKDPPRRLISGMEKKKARTMMMAELTHHWHQAWMTKASRYVR